MGVETAVVDSGKGSERPVGYWSQSLRLLLSDPMAIVGGLLILVLLLMSLVGPVVYQREPNLQVTSGLTLEGSPVGPSWDFPLGSDERGRDELARLLAGARVSFAASFLSNAIAATLGLLVGGIAGLSAGMLRQVLMRALDVILSFPVLLLAMVFLSVARPSILSVAIIIGVGWGAYLGRIVFGIVQSLAARDLMASAVAIGASRGRILVRHMLPHALPVVIVYTMLGVGVAIQAEAVFGYIGVGIQPPDASWGNMIAEGQGYIFVEPRLVLVPAAAVTLAVLGFALLGDALRQALDPTLVRDRTMGQIRRA